MTVTNIIHTHMHTHTSGVSMDSLYLVWKTAPTTCPLSRLSWWYLGHFSWLISPELKLHPDEVGLWNEDVPPTVTATFFNSLRNDRKYTDWSRVTNFLFINVNQYLSTQVNFHCSRSNKSQTHICHTDSSSHHYIMFCLDQGYEPSEVNYKTL